VRGNPRVGFDFSQDFNSGLSDHFGVKDGFGRYLLKNWMESKAAPAAQMALSTLHQAVAFFLAWFKFSSMSHCSGTGPVSELEWLVC
jgi:hypothetical protein